MDARNLSGRNIGQRIQLARTHTDGKFERVAGVLLAVKHYTDDEGEPLTRLWLDTLGGRAVLTIPGDADVIGDTW